MVLQAVRVVISSLISIVPIGGDQLEPLSGFVGERLLTRELRADVVLCCSILAIVFIEPQVAERRTEENGRVCLQTVYHTTNGSDRTIIDFLAQELSHSLLVAG